MKIVFTEDDMRRIREYEGKIVVDLHGKKRREAIVFVNNIINLVHHPFEMDLIHGYNHGTVLKEMVLEEQINRRIVNRRCSNDNLGVTHLNVA